MRVTNYLLGYKNLKIIQDNEMFNFSLDSVLLPNFVTLNKNITKILDIGSGNAPIPLILSTKTNAKITGVEIQKEVYNMALDSIELNNKQEQIDILNKDINDYYREIETDTYDVITCNPPFFKYVETSNINKNDYKTIARHEVKLNLKELFTIAKKLLKNNGVIAIVHRPERLVDLFYILRQNKLEPKILRVVQPKINKKPNLILVKAIKHGNSFLDVKEPITVYNADGSYTDEIYKIYGRER